MLKFCLDFINFTEEMGYGKFCDFLICASGSNRSDFYHSGVENGRFWNF